MNFPLVLVDVLPRRTFSSLNHHLNWEGWLRTNVDNDTSTSVSWSQQDENNLLFYDVAITIKLRIKKFLQCDLSVVKIHVNGQTMGQLSSFHKDSLWDDVWTVVLFTNDDWNVNYGGEFTLYNPAIAQYQSVSYIPNSAVVFPSNWDHKGACPLVPQAGLRTSLAITYCKSSDLEVFSKAHQSLAKFIVQ